MVSQHNAEHLTDQTGETIMLKPALFGLIAAAASLSAFASAQCTAHPQSEQIPAAKFQELLKQQGYQIKKFKTSGNCYEIYGKNKKGQKVEIYFDTKTGQAVKSEIN